MTELEGVALRGTEAEKMTVSFSCAPADERPKNEAAGTCSHFVAKTPWMKPGTVYRVETALPIGDKKIAMVWRDYEAKKYAHHEE